MVKVNCTKCGKELIFPGPADLKRRFKFKSCLGCYRKYFMKGEYHPGWKGGLFYRSGYKFVYNPSHPHAIKLGYIREHRLVMESALGRYLLPHEIVHHINHIKDDNRIENLTLITSSEHTRHHMTKNRLCSFESCEKKHLAKGYCKSHYRKIFNKN